MTTDSVDTCRNVSNWLMKRLGDNSPHVKRKVLLIIKYVAKNGESDFARNVVLHSEEIKKCTMFKGPTDPVHGDSFNKAVRETAKEAISAVFERSDSTTNSVWMKNKTSDDIYHGTQTTETFSNYGQHSSNNYGNDYISSQSSNHNGGIQGGFSGYSQNGLRVSSSGGIGPAPETPETGKFFCIFTFEESWTDWSKKGISNAVKYVKETSIKNPISYVLGSGRKDSDKIYLSEDSLRNGLYNGGGDNLNGFTDGGSYRPNPSWEQNNGPSSWNSGGIGSTSNWQQQQQQKSWNQPQIPEENDQGSYKPDPEWKSEPEKKEKKKGKESMISHVLVEPKSSIWNSNENSGSGSGVSGSEKQLVDEITEPSAKLQPTRQQLNDFCTKTKSLDIDLIASLLEQKLNSSNWQVKLRALYCVESLLKVKCTEVADYFTEKPESIQNLMDSPQEGLNTKSQKIAKTLDIQPKVKVEKPKKPKKQVEIQSNLFDGMVTKETEEEEGDLFDGMETKDEEEEEEEPVKKPKKAAPKKVKTVQEPAPKDYLLDIDSEQELKKAPKEVKKQDSSNLLDEFFGSPSTAPVEKVEKKVTPQPSPQFVNQYQPTSPSTTVQYVYPNQPQTVYIVQQQPPRRMQTTPTQQYPMPQKKSNDGFSFLNESSNVKNESSPFDFIQQEMNTRTGK